MHDYRFCVGDEERAVQIEAHGDGYRVRLGDRVADVLVLRVRAGEVVFVMDGQVKRAAVVRAGDDWLVGLPGQPPLRLGSVEPVRAARRHSGGEDVLTASMPSTVVQVLVAVDDVVEKGQPLVVLEAMKMETRVTAPHAGRVSAVHVAQGEVVDRGQMLVEVAAVEGD